MSSEISRTNPSLFPAFKKIEKKFLPFIPHTGLYAAISLKIFAQLRPQDLYRASLVCKEWNQLIEQADLWKKLYSESFRVSSPEERLHDSKANFADLSSPPWNLSQIVKSLWHDPTSIISDTMVAKVNTAAHFLSKEGFELKGVASDGDCFFSAFLGSYACLSRKIPLLDGCEDKISYLRQVLADIVKHTDSERAEEIKRKSTWVSGLGEGDLLASSLSIPIRLVTINEEKLVCGIHDRLIFSEQGLCEENRSQEWKTIPQKERPQEYIFIVDLGGHFVYAQPIKRDFSLSLDSKSSSNIFLSNSLPANALKSPLETLNSKELLSDKEIKEAEEAYTQALKRAVEEKDLIQESLCIERLGDIYLRKETSETLLQAAGLYNYALRLASQERQEILRNRLFQVQNLLVKQCNGKPFDFKVMKNQFESNRSTLKIFREKIEEKIQILPENPSSQEVRELYKEIAQGMKDFFKILVEQSIDTLEPAPCEYSMIGFGSLAREEMTPYSDLEFGILIQQDTPVNRKYFRNLTNLLHLKVINLGETILPALNIPCLKAINFFDGMTPRGFAFDGAGVEGKGCKTPFGNGKTFELIQTPGQMAQYMGKDEEGQWWHEKEPHLPMELLNFTHLFGDRELTAEYARKIQLNLNMPYQEGLNLRQHLAKQHLFYEDMAAFEPETRNLERHEMLFRVKNDFYRFPHLALDRLALIKKLEASDIFTRIDELNKQGVLTQTASEKLKDWMSIALFMRLKTYFHYQAQQEMMNPLIKPFGFENPHLIKKQFTLDSETLEKIKAIYCVCIPFYQAMREFLAGNEDDLKFSKLEDDSPKTQGDIAFRLFQYEEAKKWYHIVLQENPQNAQVLNALGMLYQAQEAYEKAAKYINQSLSINLACFGENHPAVARCYSNLGLIYQNQGNIKKAFKCINKALAINIKLYGENFFLVAIIYNQLRMLYEEVGNLGEAFKYIKKVLEIDPNVISENYPAVARDYNSLGQIYQEQGNLKEAFNYIKKALEIDRNIFCENHPVVARDYSNLGGIYKEQGDLEQSIKYVKKALKINKKLFEKDNPVVARLYNNLGIIYQAQGDLEKAAEYVNQGLAINIKLYGNNHPNVARDFNTLGEIYKEQEKLEIAVRYAKKAIKIDIGLYGKNHPVLARDFSTLGEIYKEQSKLEKAAEYVKKAKEIDIKLYGEDHPDVAASYNNLGTIYQTQGNLEQAAEYIKKALAINLKLYGENHPTVATRYNNLGTIYLEQGNLERAAEYIKKALVINFKLYGEIHPTVAMRYNNLGTIYLELANLKKAAEYIKKALVINLKLYGENHPNVAASYHNLGTIYMEQGNLKKAAEYISKALTINFKLLGENHPDVAASYNNLGTIYQTQGNLKKAGKYIKKALAINLRLDDENHPDVAIRYNNLAEIFREQGKLEKAVEYAQKALTLNLNLLGKNHSEVATNYHVLGKIYQEQGRLEEATKYSKKALSLNLRLYGKNHPRLAKNYTNLGIIHTKQGDLGQAIAYTTQALTISRMVYDENSPDRAIIYNNLGQIYQNQGNLEEAREYSKKALVIKLKLYGENHPDVAISYNNLGTIYQTQGNLEKATEYTKKALAINLKLYGENHPTVATRYNNLGQIYKKYGDLEKASEYTSKALDINLKLYGENHPHMAIGYDNLKEIYQYRRDLEKQTNI
ncbi:tetratricopeptide repeat protein [Neochlamydia sp. AcF65]|uniref:tetratricopeptide repeat protein n=1 Tax=Neochlamydia sp. AcF65 TaxID=2795735 RepID=UPI001BC9C9B4|nr:tetratricopeptide repeat protein [Neochlamydia sp. AcF65]